MPVVAVVNRKGGSGKSTLATHLAGHCARLGLRVMLGDVDRQQSSLAWLRRRAAQSLAEGAAIVGWAVDPRSVMRPPSGVTHVVLDTPGGLRGFDLARVVMGADAVVIPVCDSAFDRESAAECHAELMTLPRVANGQCKVAVVGMRVDARTKGGDRLQAWATQLGLPYLGAVRSTQVYVRCAEQGLTLFDLPPAKAGAADLAQWQPVVGWLESAWQAAERAQAKSREGEAPIRVAAAARSTHRPSPASPTPRAAVASLEALAARETPRRGSAAGLGWLFSVFRSST